VPRSRLFSHDRRGISFELAEYSLQHQLPNFAEVRCPERKTMLMLIYPPVLVGSCETQADNGGKRLTFLISGSWTYSFATGWAHTSVRKHTPHLVTSHNAPSGMKTCQYFDVKHFEWRGLRQTRGVRAKTKRVIKQFAPADFTAFKWEGAKDLLHYVTTVLLLAVFLAAELNAFYLKARPSLTTGYTS
jgi:hypothetical protein